MTTAADPTNYPAPRKRAGAPENLDEEDSGPIPRTRVFTWLINETATSRRSVSTPRLVGPVIIKDISYDSSVVNATFVKSIEIGYATQPVTEAGVVLATARPYTLLTELLDPFAQSFANAGGGLEHMTTPAASVRFKVPLDLIVDVPECYVVVALVNASSNAQIWHGGIRVVEAVSRDALRFFL